MLLFSREQLNIEDQNGVGRNWRWAVSTVCITRRGHKIGALANLHLCNTLVPSLDDLATANVEGERPALRPRGVENLAIEQGALVVERTPRTGCGLRTRTFLNDDLDEARHFNCFECGTNLTMVLGPMGSLASAIAVVGLLTASAAHWCISKNFLAC